MTESDTFVHLFLRGCRTHLHFTTRVVPIDTPNHTTMQAWLYKIALGLVKSAQTLVIHFSSTTHLRGLSGLCDTFGEQKCGLKLYMRLWAMHGTSQLNSYNRRHCNRLQMYS